MRKGHEAIGTCGDEVRTYLNLVHVRSDHFTIFFFEEAAYFSFESDELLLTLTLKLESKSIG